MEVRFEKIAKSYGDFQAVRRLDLTIKDGALHFLLGPSGCGKTTTLRMLAGLEAPSAGRIFFDDKDVTDLPAADRGIGMVFQNYALWPHMNVRKNVEYGLTLRKLGSTETKRRLDEALALTQLTSFAERLPGQLSGGQQQRVALARALAIQPTVLLLDEPLSNLDAKLRLEMRDNITRLHKQKKITTVYVTHDQKESLSMGTHVSVMRAGHLIQTDTPRALYRRPATPFIAGFIGETNLVTGKLVVRQAQQALVETSFGKLRGETLPDCSLKIGDEVMLSFRPESLLIDVAGNLPEDCNRLDLMLEHITYLGESELWELRAKDGTSLKGRICNPPDHKVLEGSAIACGVLARHVLVLPPEADLRSGT